MTFSDPDQMPWIHTDTAYKSNQFSCEHVSAPAHDVLGACFAKPLSPQDHVSQIPDESASALVDTPPTALGRFCAVCAICATRVAGCRRDLICRHVFFGLPNLCQQILHKQSINESRELLRAAPPWCTLSRWGDGALRFQVCFRQQV